MEATSGESTQSAEQLEYGQGQLLHIVPQTPTAVADLPCKGDGAGDTVNSSSEGGGVGREVDIAGQRATRTERLTVCWLV